MKTSCSDIDWDHLSLLYYIVTHSNRYGYLWEQYQTTKIQERIKSNVFTSENEHIGAVYLDLRCYINFKEYELCKKEIKLKAEIETQTDQTIYFKQEQQDVKQWEHSKDWSPEYISAMKLEPGIAFEDTRGTVKPLSYEETQTMAEYLVKPETSSEDSAVFKQIPELKKHVFGIATGTNTDMGPMFRKGKRMFRTSPDLNLHTKQTIRDGVGFKWEKMVSPAHVTSQAASPTVSPVLYEQETEPQVYQTVHIKQEQQEFKQCEHWSPEDSSAIKHEPGIAFEETRRTVKPLRYEDAQNMAEYLVKRETSSNDSAMKTEKMEYMNYEVKKQSVDTLKLEFKHSPEKTDTDMDSMFQKVKRMRLTSPDLNLRTKHTIGDESGFKWEEMLAPAHVTSQAASASVSPVLYGQEIKVQNEKSDAIRLKDKVLQTEQNKQEKKTAHEVQDIPEVASFDDLVNKLDKEINKSE
ncbi:uncharacterized protein LOC144360397 [Saccoglossus kowalevskii]